FKVFDGCGQRARAKHETQIVRFLQAEPAGDSAGVLDSRLNHGSRVHPVVKYDGHLALEVCFGEFAEALRGRVGKGEADFVASGIIGAGDGLRAAQVAAGDGRVAVHEVIDIRGSAGLSRGALFTSGEQFRIGWEQAVGLSAVGFRGRGVGAGADDDAELELSAGLDDALGASGVAFAGKL